MKTYHTHIERTRVRRTPHTRHTPHVHTTAAAIAVTVVAPVVGISTATLECTQKDAVE